MSALFPCYHAVHSQCKVLCLAHRAIHLKITCYLLNLVFLFTLTLNTHLDLMISFQFISTVASGQLLFTSFWIFQCVHSGENIHLIAAALRIHISRIIQVLKIFQAISFCLCEREACTLQILGSMLLDHSGNPQP